MLFLLTFLIEYKGPEMEKEDISKTRNLFSVSIALNDIHSLDNDSGGDTLSAEQQVSFFKFDQLQQLSKRLVEWVNTHLNKLPNSKEIHNLTSDLRSGVAILQLLQAVTGVTGIGNYEKDPKNLWQCIQNAQAIFRFIALHTFQQVAVCTPQGNRLQLYL